MFYVIRQYIAGKEIEVVCNCCFVCEVNLIFHVEFFRKGIVLPSLSSSWHSVSFCPYFLDQYRYPIGLIQEIPSLYRCKVSSIDFFFCRQNCFKRLLTLPLMVWTCWRCWHVDFFFFPFSRCTTWKTTISDFNYPEDRKARMSTFSDLRRAGEGGMRSQAMQSGAACWQWRSRRSSAAWWIIRSFYIYNRFSIYVYNSVRGQLLYVYGWRFHCWSAQSAWTSLKAEGCKGAQKTTVFNYQMMFFFPLFRLKREHILSKYCTDTGLELPSKI